MITRFQSRTAFAVAGKSALMFGTALGSAIIVFSASPQQAWAADECGADVAGVATCDNSGVPATNANPYPTGIDYVADPAEDITVNVTGAVVVNAIGDGVTATGVAGFEATVNTAVGATITSDDDGIDVYTTGADSEVLNYATITAGDQGIEATAFGVNADVYVTNYGDISVVGSGNVYGFAEGIFAASNEGVTIVNQGAINVYSTDDATANGISAYAGSEIGSVINFGDITVETGGGTATGIRVEGSAYVYAASSGEISVTGSTIATGILTESVAGNVGVDTDGDISAYAGTGAATGISVDAAAGSAILDLSGNIIVGSTLGNAYGIDVDTQGDIELDSIGDIESTGYGYTYGMFIVSTAGVIDADIAGDVYSTSTNDDAYGIDLDSYNGTTLVLAGNVYVDGVVDATGLDISSENGDSVVSVTGNVTVTADDNVAYGIQVDAGDDISVDVTGNVYVSGYNLVLGIDATSDTGYSDIDVIGDVSAFSSSGYAYAVDVDAATSGYVDISGNVTASAYNDAIGVNVDADLGDAVVLVGGTINATSTAGDAFGVYAVAYDDVYVYVDGAITTDAYDFGAGVYALSSDGDITIRADGDITTTAGNSAYGIYAIGDYDAAIYVSADISAYSPGNLAYGVDINVGGDAFMSLLGDVYAGGATFNTGLDIDADGFAQTYVTGDITVLGFSGTALGISTYSSLGTYVTTDGAIYVYGSTTATGIEANSAIDTTVNFAGTLFAGSANTAYGIDATATDDVFVNVDGSITANGGTNGEAIHADAGDYVSIDIDSGFIYGSDLAIHSDSTTGTLILNDGTLSSGGAFFVDVDGGSASIYNGGYMYGAVDLTDNPDFIYNDGVWEAYGTSYFGLGSDEVDNVGFFGFSRYQGLASTTTLYSLEFFDNYSVVSGVDGQVNDELAITGNFFGGAGSELDLDVQLGGPGSAADRLIIGSASGVTEIEPNDLLAASPGALNFGGILVVNSANAAETGAEFVMDNVDKGFVEYELFFDAATDNWLIVGLPDQEAFELLAAMSSGQDFWRRSGDAMAARFQELRDEGGASGMNAGAGGVGAGRSDGWELWMQAHGGEEGFDNVQDFSINGFLFAQDLSAESDWRGFQFGFDNLQGNFLWGLTMGFNQQETTFDFDSNSFDTEGWNVGGYVSWGTGGWFVNGLLKADFYEQDANFHTIPTLFTFDGVTWGLQGEIGYRWEGDGFFVEPLAQLAWSTTDLDSVTTAGADIDFDDSESLRGKFGARIGGTWGSGDVVWTPYIGAYYVDEWEGDNSLTFTTGPTAITFADQGRGSYGLADFGITFQSFYGLEGFVKGEWNFGGDADGGAARLGARWRW